MQCTVHCTLKNVYTLIPSASLLSRTYFPTLIVSNFCIEFLQFQARRICLTPYRYINVTFYSLVASVFPNSPYIAWVQFNNTLCASITIHSCCMVFPFFFIPFIILMTSFMSSDNAANKIYNIFYKSYFRNTVLNDAWFVHIRYLQVANLAS